MFVFGDGGKKEEGGWHGIINDPSASKPVLSGAEEHWPAIYERCGGNIGMLARCVEAARKKKTWDAALHSVVATLYSAIKQAFDPTAMPQRDEPPQWTEHQWETVLEVITEAPHHAVLRDDLAKKLGKGDVKAGNRIILSLVRYNLLALRPYSTLARDLPLEVYGDAKEEVVTLPSPGHVWAAKQILLNKRKGAADAKA